MKLTLICERCNSEVELKPETNGQHAYVHKSFKNQFKVSDIVIESDVSTSLDNEFVNKLAKSNEIENITNILDDGISYNTDVEANLDEIRFNCQNCGDYIVLTQFN